VHDLQLLTELQLEFLKVPTWGSFWCGWFGEPV